MAFIKGAAYTIIIYYIEKIARLHNQILEFKTFLLTQNCSLETSLVVLSWFEIQYFNSSICIFLT